MAKVTKKNLVLAFTTSSGGNLKLTINAPKPDMEGTEIAAAMDAIIDTGVLGKEEVAAHRVSATYVTQEEQEVELA